MTGAHFLLVQAFLDISLKEENVKLDQLFSVEDNIYQLRFENCIQSRNFKREERIELAQTVASEYGFSLEATTAALKETNYDVQKAINLILEQQEKKNGEENKPNSMEWSDWSDWGASSTRQPPSTQPLKKSGDKLVNALFVDDLVVDKPPDSIRLDKPPKDDEKEHSFQKLGKAEESEESEGELFTAEELSQEESDGEVVKKTIPTKTPQQDTVPPKPKDVNPKELVDSEENPALQGLFFLPSNYLHAMHSQSGGRQPKSNLKELADSLPQKRNFQFIQF